MGVTNLEEIELREKWLKILAKDNITPSVCKVFRADVEELKTVK